MAFRNIGDLQTSLKIGDEAGGNNTEIEIDGTIKFNGDATVWEDLNFGILEGGGPTATLPTDITINNVFYKEFTSSNNQTCGGQREIPHAAKIGAGVKFYPHLHCFLKSGESAGTTGVSFTIYWELRENGNIVTNGSVLLTATTEDLTTYTSKLTLYDETGFDAPSTIGAQLSMRLARTGGDAGDVVVTTYGIHLEYDTIGSRTLSTK